MPSGVELATAWVRIVPTMEGLQGALAEALGPLEEESDRKGKESGKRFGGAMFGAIAGVAASLASSAVNALGNMVGEMAAQVDSTQKFAQTLSFAGIDDSNIKNLTKSTKAYADSTVYGLGDIRNITAQLASNGVKDFDKLAEAGGNLNAVAGGNAQTFKSVGMVLTQTAGQGKLTTENWNQLADAIPGAAGPLMDALLKAGAYTGNFRDAMQKGEISADEFNAALMELGTDPVAVEAAKSTTTFEGALGSMQASIVSVGADLLTKLQPGINAVALGIGEFAGVVGPFLSFLIDSPPLLAALGVILIGALVPSIIAATVATWAWTAALLANPLTWIILAIAALVAGIIFLAMNWDAVVAWINTVWSGFLSWATSVTDGFVAWWNAIWAAVGAWIESVWSGFIGWITDTWNGFIGWVMGVVNGFFGWWNGIWAAVGAAIQSIWSGFIAWITGLWTGYIAWVLGNINAFLGWWNGIWNSVGSAIRTIWAAFIAAVQSVWSGFIGWVQSIVNGFMGWWNGIWATVGNALNAGFNAARSVAQSVLSGIISWINGAVNGFFGWWNGIWGTVGDAVRNAFNGVAGFIGGIWDGIVSRIRGAVNGIVGTINGMIGALNGLLGGIGKLTGMNLSLPKIPGLATGGTVKRGGTVLVGENGPELLNLPRGASVDPDITNTGGGKNVIFNNYAPLGQSPAQALTQFANRAGGLNI